MRRKHKSIYIWLLAIVLASGMLWLGQYNERRLADENKINTTNTTNTNIPDTSSDTSDTEMPTEVPVVINPVLVPIGSVLPDAIIASGIDSTFGGFDTDTSAFTTVITDGGIKVLHYAPGTNANYSNWYLPGMGILESEINRDTNGTTKLKEAAWTTEFSYRFYDKYVSLLKASGAKAFPSLNVSSQVAPGFGRFDQASIDLATKDNLAMIADMKSKGVAIMAVQLGVESYLSGYEDIFPTVENYIQRVKPIALAIKTAYPNIDIYIHPAPYDKSGKRLSEWNAALALQNDFFDGTIIYSWLQVDPSCGGTVDQQFSCMNKVSKTFIDTTYPAQIAGTLAAFPGKKIAISQYNIKLAGDYDTSSDNNTLYQNTMFQAIHTADFILGGVATYNAYHNNPVTAATFMNMSGSDRNLISKFDKASEDVGNVKETGGIVKRASWQALHLLEGLFDAKHHLLALTYTVQGSIPADVRVYGFTNGTQQDLIIINRSGVALPLSSIKFTNGFDFGETSFTAEAMLANSLGATYGAKGDQNTTTSQIVLSGPSSYDSIASVMIAPYSIVRIHIPN
ncbi:hypothetical protein IPF86_00400 [Candidatus Nomurabacteria bacterium]|nr:MAG: hypothetical protein IPF86_00400 [Candidatus Nomurabacteria bacterium]